MQFFREHHARQACIDISGRNQISEIALWLDQGDRLATRWPLLAFAGLIEHVPQLLRKFAVAATRFVRGSLHGNSIELFVVAIEMALEQRDEMRGCRHTPIAILTVPNDFIINTRAVSLRQRRETSGKSIAPQKTPGRFIVVPRIKQSLAPRDPSSPALPAAGIFRDRVSVAASKGRKVACSLRPLSPLRRSEADSRECPNCGHK